MTFPFNFGMKRMNTRENEMGSESAPKRAKRLPSNKQVL